jgi:hypothetical protein
MGLTVNNIVEMRNVALECFPQRDLANCHHMRDGKGFVAEKLDSPVVFYTHGKKIPLKNSVLINYMTFDCSLPFNKWKPMWYTYNLYDNFVALALLEKIGIRLVELEGLSLQADIGRHIRGYLAHLKDFPAKKEMVHLTDQDLRPLPDWFEGPIVRSMGPEPLLFKTPIAFASLEDTVKTAKRTSRYDTLDKYQIDSEALARYEKAMGNIDFDHWKVELSMKHAIQPGPMFPHPCKICGQMDHRKDEVGSNKCSRKQVECIYNLCLTKGDHKIMACPVLNLRCTTCREMGHKGHDHQTMSPTRLRNECMIAAQFGVISNRLLDTSKAFVMNPVESDILIVDALDAIPAHRRMRD